ncbi:MAG: TVP38/TMEM64 family protein [Roseovarius sp.]|nr:TVP38/TMEM64 family protein [Roseovarius sp.]
MRSLTQKRTRLSAAILIVAISIWLFFHFHEVTQNLNSESIFDWVEGAGFWGPVLVVVLMAIAIVATPIPSAPIALASGAVYGHFFGTVYVVLGAEIGAMVAFTLARVLGRDVLKHWLGERTDFGWLGSQNALTLAVFSSRLMPFVSFDLVSYAAGLSSLRFWRFALATLTGILPASFLLAHFGEEAVGGETWQATMAAIVIGLFVAIPVAVAFIRRQQANRRETGSS